MKKQYITLANAIKINSSFSLDTLTTQLELVVRQLGYSLSEIGTNDLK